MRKYVRGWLLIAFPLIIGFLLFYIVPFGYSVYYSLLENVATKKFAGMANFLAVINNRFFQLALKNTLFFVVIDVPLLLSMALGLALMLYNSKANNNVLQALLILPLLLPSAAVTPMFEIISDMMSDSFAIHVLFVWKYIGIFALIFLAARETIPKDYYEAAAIDGANTFRVFSRITLPLLLPVVAFAAVMGIVYNLRIFKEIYLLYGAYPDEAVYLTQHYMNNQFSKLNYPLLTSSGLLFSLTLLIPTGIVFWVIRRRRHE